MKKNVIIMLAAAFFFGCAKKLKPAPQFPGPLLSDTVFFGTSTGGTVLFDKQATVFGTHDYTVLRFDTIKITTVIQFKKGSAEISRVAKIDLLRLCGALISWGGVFEAQGYASNERSPGKKWEDWRESEYNLNLSIRRANAVCEKLELYGLPKDRCSPSGSGETDALGGLEQNRAVIFYVP